MFRHVAPRGVVASVCQARSNKLTRDFYFCRDRRSGLPGACKLKNAQLCFKKRKNFGFYYIKVYRLKKAIYLINSLKFQGQPIKKGQIFGGSRKSQTWQLWGGCADSGNTWRWNIHMANGQYGANNGRGFILHTMYECITYSLNTHNMGCINRIVSWYWYIVYRIKTCKPIIHTPLVPFGRVYIFHCIIEGSLHGYISQHSKYFYLYTLCYYIQSV